MFIQLITIMAPILTFVAGAVLGFSFGRCSHANTVVDEQKRIFDEQVALSRRPELDEFNRPSMN